MNWLLPFLLALAAPDDAPRVLAVRTFTLGARAAVQVVCTSPLGDVDVQREGADVLVLALPALAPPDLALPAGVAQVSGLQMSTAPAGLLLRVRTTPGAPYEVLRDAGMLTLLVGSAAEDEAGSEDADTTARYRQLFPGSAGDGGEEGGGGQVRPELAGDEGMIGAGVERQGQGLRLGPFTFNPAVVVSYDRVRGSFTELGSDDQWHDYLQIEPSLGLRLGSPVLHTRLFGLRLSYRPRFRGFSSLRELKEVAHEFTGELKVPLTAAITFTAYDRYMRGLAEAAEVDRGREYFTRLGRFEHNELRLTLIADTGGPLILDAGAARETVNFLETSSFFSYDRDTVRGRVAYRLGQEDRRLGVSYIWSRVPAPAERRVALTYTKTLQAELSGEIVALTRGRLYGGYTRLNTPNVAGETQNATWVAGADVKKEFSRSAWASVFAERTTPVSAFEGNAFYITSTVGALATVPLKFHLALTAGINYRRNEYRQDAAALGLPREDSIKGWTVGVGRPFGKRIYLRGDYINERRHSNLTAFNGRTQAFAVQLGVGLFAQPDGVAR